jgi:transposase
MTISRHPTVINKTTEAINPPRRGPDQSPPELVADLLGVGRSSVFGWQKAYREGGLAALSTKFASGRPTILSDQQMMLLYAMIVDSDPRQHSFGVALWTRGLIADLIEQKFGVRLSLPTGGRILKKLGMSPQRPAYRAYQQDPEKVRCGSRRPTRRSGPRRPLPVRPSSLLMRPGSGVTITRVRRGLRPGARRW